jgi:hypothetical protein
MTDRQKPRRLIDWQDIGFSPLPPGWINVYKSSDGRHYTGPCPGVIVQEATTETLVWDEPLPNGKFTLRQEIREIDRQTRTVFADTPWPDDSSNGPVEVDHSGDYVVTTTPEHWDAWQAEEQSDKEAS